MNAKELFNLSNSASENESGSFEEFISEFEDKWLQFSDEETKVKAYFGSVEKGLKLFEKWKAGFELFSDEKNNAFPEPYRFTE
jgi:hypothetical protein